MPVHGTFGQLCLSRRRAHAWNNRFLGIFDVCEVIGAGAPGGQMTQQAAALVQIGQLLTKSGLLSSEDLAEALIRARERGLPIGTVLLTMGHLRQEELRAAVEAQSLVNDGLVNSDLAVTALLKSTKEKTTFEHALKSLGWSSQHSRTNKLGELLLDAGVISQEQLNDCLTTGKDTGMPLGRVLLFKRTISDEMLVAGLRAQRYVREGLIPRADALEVLKKVHQKKVSLEETLAEGGFLKTRSYRRTPVGFLLVEAGFIKEVSLMMCVELSLTENRPVVDTLVEQGFASRAMAQGCLTIQQLIDAGTLTKDMALAALRAINSENYDADEAVAAVGMPEIDASRKQLLHELFVLCGSVDPKEMPVLDGDLSSYAGLRETLLSTQRIAEHMIPCVVRALNLIDRKLLGSEDAVMALHYCRRNQTSLDEALTIMGWKAPTSVKI